MDFSRYFATLTRLYVLYKMEGIRMKKFLLILSLCVFPVCAMQEGESHTAVKSDSWENPVEQWKCGFDAHGEGEKAWKKFQQSLQIVAANRWPQRLMLLRQYKPKR